MAGLSMVSKDGRGDDSAERQVAAPDAAVGWFVYVLRCADDTLYTGIATDVQRRLQEHNGDARLAAKYTRSRRPLELVYSEPALDRAAACRREQVIKRLSRWAKLALIAADKANGAALDRSDVIEK
jgi:putative endonuclease